MKANLDAEEISLRAGESLRSLLLDQRRVRYVLRRSTRQTLALSVGPRGLRVSAPRAASIAAIEAFVQAHRAWALARLNALDEASAARRVVVENGAQISLVGSPLRLHHSARARGARWCLGSDGIEELHLPGTNCLRALERALRARALAWFEGRVEEFCLRLGVAVPPVALGAARTRWGSCSARSGIRLHWKLALLSPAVADYVVAHEVAHLREMNHSPRFWQLVGTLSPQWRSLRARLREEGARLPEFVMPAAGPGAAQEEMR